MNKTIFLHQNWFYMVVLQILIAMSLLNANLETVCANAVTPEIPTASDNENEFLLPQDEKDEYGDIYYPWHKEAVMDDSADLMPVMVFFANSAMMEDLTNGNNGEINDDNLVNQKRGWKKMNVAWGKRRNAGQYMNRDYAPSASATGSWGKREPNWNNLKGMWGKRSDINASSYKRAASKSGQWNYLKGSWGKRSTPFAKNN